MHICNTNRAGVYTDRGMWETIFHSPRAYPIKPRYSKIGWHLYYWSNMCLTTIISSTVLIRTLEYKEQKHNWKQCNQKKARNDPTAERAGMDMALGTTKPRVRSSLRTLSPRLSCRLFSEYAIYSPIYSPKLPSLTQWSAADTPDSQHKCSQTRSEHKGPFLLNEIWETPRQKMGTRFGSQADPLDPWARGPVDPWTRGQGLGGTWYR